MIELELSPAEPNPDYQPASILPQANELAGRLDLASWAFRKPVGAESPGVQELELDLEVLAHAQPGYADLRLMHGDRQVPYILERRSVLRALKPIVRNADDPDQPRHSRWIIQLPSPHLPVTRFTCNSPTPLFRREFNLYEMPSDSRGARYRRQLGGGTWVHLPESPALPLILELEGTPLTDELYLETDNADNPPLQLAGFEFGYPVIRIFFKASPGSELFLYFGNPRVNSPQYDLRLVAHQITAAEKARAFLGAVEPMRGLGGLGDRMMGNSGILFWGVLVLVVVSLLVLINRLLPKPPAP